MNSKFLISAITLSAMCLFCSCQATPEQAVVQEKSSDYIQSMLDTEEAEAILQVPDRLQYSLENDSLGVQTTVRIDAELIVPDVMLPIVSVSPQDISWQSVQGLLDELQNDRPLYDQETCAIVEFKSDIQKQINSYEQEMEQAEAIGNDTSFYLEQLQELYRKLALAPDSVEEANDMLASGQLEPVTMLTGGGFMSTPDKGTAVTNASIEAFELNSENYDDKYYYLILGMGTNNTATLQLNARYDSAFPQILEYIDTSADVPALDYSGDLSLMSDFPASLDEAVEKATPLVQAIDSDLAFFDAAAIVDISAKYTDGTEQPWGYRLVFTRSYGEAQENYAHALEGMNSKTDVTYNEEYPQESLVVEVCLEGIYSVRYYAPKTEIAVEEASVQLLPFEEVQRIFDQNIVLNQNNVDAYIQIEKAELGLMRISRPDSGDYLVIPVWDFYGNGIMASDTGIYQEDEYWNQIADRPDVSWLTINAVNGAIINRYLGY